MTAEAVRVARSAVVLVEDGRVALIRRERAGVPAYYLYPGGTVEPGESPEAAAVREAREELGLEVRLGHLVALVTFDGIAQYYFRATRLGGTFGTGDGPELRAGGHEPVWMPLDDVPAHDVRPRGLLGGAADEERL
jgi:8-oxo-dGTP diphosphatase